TIDEEVLRSVKVRAARTGKGDGEVIEEALRRDLGMDLLDRLWGQNDLSEGEALERSVREHMLSLCLEITISLASSTSCPYIHQGSFWLY
ncbi:MAG: hypothetical protein ACSLFB_08705, partial [Acidimicrobiales bacterium]